MELRQDLKQQYHRTVKGESCDSAVGSNVRGIRTGAGSKEERSFIAPGCWSFRVIAELTRSRLITNLLARIPGGLLSGAEPDFAPGL